MQAVRPIVFGAESIHGIESGLKSQTRRLGLPRPTNEYLGYMMLHGSGGGGVATMCGEDYPDADDDEVRCPHGKPGDILWVREAWAPVARPPVRAGRYHDKCIANPDGSDYKQEDPKIKGVTWKAAWMTSEGVLGNPSGYKWCSPRFMPKWASRMFIRIDNIRVQRLRDISDRDVKAEGIKGKGNVWFGHTADKDHFRAFTTPQEAFASHWDAINAKRNPPRVWIYEGGKKRVGGWKERQTTPKLPWCCWAANDWVWVLEFSVAWRYGTKVDKE